MRFVGIPANVDSGTMNPDNWINEGMSRRQAFADGNDDNDPSTIDHDVILRTPSWQQYPDADEMTRYHFQPAHSDAIATGSPPQRYHATRDTQASRQTPSEKQAPLFPYANPSVFDEDEFEDSKLPAAPIPMTKQSRRSHSKRYSISNDPFRKPSEDSSLSTPDDIHDLYPFDVKIEPADSADTPGTTATTAGTPTASFRGDGPVWHPGQNTMMKDHDPWPNVPYNESSAYPTAYDFSPTVHAPYYAYDDAYFPHPASQYTDAGMYASPYAPPASVAASPQQHPRLSAGTAFNTPSLPHVGHAFPSPRPLQSRPDVSMAESSSRRTGTRGSANIMQPKTHEQGDTVPTHTSRKSKSKEAIRHSSNKAGASRNMACPPTTGVSTTPGNKIGLLTSSGESSSQLRREPSKREMDEAKTPRAKSALTTWYERYRELIQYKERHGHCNVPQKYSPNPPLGVWVNKQRMEKKFRDEGNTHARMSDEKLEALDAIGFNWAKRKGDHSWNEKYAQLCQYKEEVGDCDVPTKYPANPALGRWVSTQRAQYKEFRERKKTQMTLQRMNLLNRIGFKWSMVDGSESQGLLHSPSSFSSSTAFAMEAPAGIQGHSTTEGNRNLSANRPAATSIHPRRINLKDGM